MLKYVNRASDLLFAMARFADVSEPELFEGRGGVGGSQVKVSARRRKGYAHTVTFEHHTLIVDEPVEKGGADTGPRPTALLAMSLASCTAITIEMYANRKEWDVGRSRRSTSTTSSTRRPRRASTWC